MTIYPAFLTPDWIYTIATLIYVTGILTGVVLTNIQNRRLDDNRPRRGDLPGAAHDRAARESVPFAHYGND